MRKGMTAAALAGTIVAASAATLIGNEGDAPATSRPITVVPAAARPAPAPIAATKPVAVVAPSDGWTPALADTWQWQLTGTINTSYDVKIYDIDLFDAPDATLSQLHAAGRKIVCYFSAGSAENWRPDYKQFKKSDLGKPLDGWPGERWVDIRSQTVRDIMAARLDLARTRGCDGVEPDNVDAYDNKNGLGLTPDDQLDYNRFLATEARRRGLKVGLKNDLAQVKTLEPAFDFAVNEQCHQYRECDKLQPFVAAGKPVFNAEYKAKYRDNTNGARDQLCRDARAENLRTLVLPLKLNDAYRYSCD